MDLPVCMVWMVWLVFHFGYIARLYVSVYGMVHSSKHTHPYIHTHANNHTPTRMHTISPGIHTCIPGMDGIRNMHTCIRRTIHIQSQSPMHAPSPMRTHAHTRMRVYIQAGTHHHTGGHVGRHTCPFRTHTLIHNIVRQPGRHIIHI